MSVDLPIQIPKRPSDQVKECISLTFISSRHDTNSAIYILYIGGDINVNDTNAHHPRPTLLTRKGPSVILDDLAEAWDRRRFLTY